jgi:hypothetical protein
MCKILESFALNSLKLASYILSINIVSYKLDETIPSSHNHSTEDCSPLVVKIYKGCGG